MTRGNLFFIERSTTVAVKDDLPRIAELVRPEKFTPIEPRDPFEFPGCLRPGAAIAPGLDECVGAAWRLHFRRELLRNFSPRWGCFSISGGSHESGYYRNVSVMSRANFFFLPRGKFDGNNRGEFWPDFKAADR